jgi:hypothetical protein
VHWQEKVHQVIGVAARLQREVVGGKMQFFIQTHSQTTEPTAYML